MCGNNAAQIAGKELALHYPECQSEYIEECQLWQISIHENANDLPDIAQRYYLDSPTFRNILCFSLISASLRFRQAWGAGFVSTPLVELSDSCRRRARLQVTRSPPTEPWSAQGTTQERTKGVSPNWRAPVGATPPNPRPTLTRPWWSPGQRYLIVSKVTIILGVFRSNHSRSASASGGEGGCARARAAYTPSTPRLSGER